MVFVSENDTGTSSHLPIIAIFWRNYVYVVTILLTSVDPTCLVLTCLLAASFAKLVYFTKNDDRSDDGDEGISTGTAPAKSKGGGSYPVIKGSLNFKKFETDKIDECLEFIKSMKLHVVGMSTIVFIISS